MSDTTQYPEGITPELLMAFADDALDADAAAGVRAALVRHPWLADEVDAYRETTRALSAAFNAPIDEPVPAHLKALVAGDALASDTVVSLQAHRKRGVESLPGWTQAIAASVVFAVGAVVGAQLFSAGAGNDLSDSLVVGQLDVRHPVAELLETVRSGDVVLMQGGQLDAVATFPTPAGEPCREFEVVSSGDTVIGIACRRSGSWTIDLLLRGGPTRNPQSGFQVASASDSGVIDAFLSDLGAEVGLAAEEEACLIAQGWNDELCE